MVDSANSYLLVGGYGVGVHCLRYDADGALAPVSSVDIADPSYVVYDDRRGVLTAVVEQEPAGRIASARFTVADGGNDVRDQTASGGSAPCHLALHPDGSALFVANFMSGTVAVFPVDAEGRVTGDEPAQVLQHTGSGPRADRQEGPHAHQAVVSPSGRWVLAVDLGTDSVYVYAYDSGRLSRTASCAARRLRPAPPGLPWLGRLLLRAQRALLDGHGLLLGRGDGSRGSRRRSRAGPPRIGRCPITPGVRRSASRPTTASCTPPTASTTRSRSSRC